MNLFKILQYIIFVNCDRARNLCKDYNVTNFPTIKIFYQIFQLLIKQNLFQFDLEYLLEYMLKISDTILSKNPLIKIKKMKQLNKFSKNYVSRISKFIKM